MKDFTLSESDLQGEGKQQDKNAEILAEVTVRNRDLYEFETMLERGREDVIRY